MQLVILSRDGVVNQVLSGGIGKPEDWQPIPGSLEAIARLNHAGYKVAVTTEQAALQSGKLNLDALNAIHARMHQLLSRVGGHVDGIFICPYGSEDKGSCREHVATLYQKVAERFSASLEGVPVISDSPDELHVAGQLGCRPLLVGANEEDNGNHVPCFDDLNHAVDHLLTL
jgi:D-glycero-D-manno-heptose 1,7-bisphosphate phosphatase